MRYIVTHNKPSHFDDFIASSLLKAFNPNAIIKHVSYYEDLSDALNDKSIAVVDIGRQYNIELLNFDHHHDINLPCSLHLVIQYLDSNFYNEYKNLQTMQYINHIDLYGPFGLNITIPGKINWMRKIIQFCDFNEYYDQIATTFVKALMDYPDDYNEFMITFVELNSNIYYKLRDFEQKLILDYETKLENSVLIEYNGFRILIAPESLVPFQIKTMYQFNIDILIEPSRDNSQYTSILRKNTNLHNFDNLALFGNIVFKHNSKFIYVIDKSLDSLQIEELIKAIV